jgi:glycine/D-amino acid oxidase-like deaminating enzyme
MIIGQGLAGSAVAIHLLNLGKKVVVFDVINENSASRIAAGLFNPITGKNKVKTWLAEETFSYLHEFYPLVESMINRKFFHPVGVFHPFSSIQEQNEWMARSSEPGLKEFIRSITVKSEKRGIKDEFGGVVINKAGYINTGVYLDGVRQLLIEQDAFVDEAVQEEDLKPEKDSVRYRNWMADRVIFCTGTGSLESKWFKQVPIISLKGETLLIKGEEIGNQVVNRGVYIVPQGSEIYNVGATYQLGDTSPVITGKGRDELIEKLKMVIAFDFEIVNQQWGMRPTTHDRRPIIGVHAASNRLVYFNGMGTKGVSISPYFARELTRWLENNMTLNKEVDISRYKLVN